jgi:hypothetical protein
MNGRAKNKGRSDVAGVPDRLPRNVTCKSHGNGVDLITNQRKSIHKAHFTKVRQTGGTLFLNCDLKVFVSKTVMRFSLMS